MKTFAEELNTRIEPIELEPIELTDDELKAVAGGSFTVSNSTISFTVSNSTIQNSINQNSNSFNLAFGDLNLAFP